MADEIPTITDLISEEAGAVELADAASSKTPPHAHASLNSIEKRKSDRKPENGTSNRGDRGKVTQLDPNVLSKALQKEFEEAGKQHRDITPGGSPSRKRQRIYGDR